MLFLIMISLGALLIASAAIYFSVLGLVQTFSETALFWGTAIEVSKLVLASFSYRYWDKLEPISKTLCVFFIGMLMFITSMGISGHILSSMQQRDLAAVSQQINIQSVVDNISRIRERINFLDQRIEDERNRLREIDEEISLVPNNYVTARRQLIQERQPEKDQIQQRIQSLFNERESLFSQLESYEAKKSDLLLESEEINIKVGPISKVVETFGGNAEKSIYIFILIIVLSFDPVAVMLTISANRVALDVKAKKDEKLKAKEKDSTISEKEQMDSRLVKEHKMFSKRDSLDSNKLDEVVKTMSYIKDKLRKDEDRKRQVLDSLS